MRQLEWNWKSATREQDYISKSFGLRKPVFGIDPPEFLSDTASSQVDTRQTYLKETMFHGITLYLALVLVSMSMEAIRQSLSCQT